MHTKKRAWGYFGLAVTFAAGVFWLESPSAHRVGIEVDIPLLPEFEVDSVYAIEIEQLLEGVRLDRKQSTWTVRALPTDLQRNNTELVHEAVDTAAYPAAATLVRGVITYLQTLNTGAVASRKSDRHDHMQVGSTGRQVRLFNDTGLLLGSFIVGKGGQDFFSHYVRRTNETEVYVVPGQVAARLPVRVKHWRDKSVWAIDADAIQKVVVERFDGGFTLERRGETGFHLAESVSPIDQQQLVSWFASWSKLDALDIADQVTPKDAGLNKPRYQLRVELRDGTARRLEIGDSDESERSYGRQNDNETLYVLPENLLQALRVDWQGWVVQPEKQENT